MATVFTVIASIAVTAVGCGSNAAGPKAGDATQSKPTQASEAKNEEVQPTKLNFTVWRWNRTPKRQNAYRAPETHQHGFGIHYGSLGSGCNQGYDFVVLG